MAKSSSLGITRSRWTATSINLKDLLQELGRQELQALGYVRHGDVPHDG